MSHDDFKFEPQRGLPEELPEGEHILWQGHPKWWAFARHVFHVRFVAGYFALIVAWRAAVGMPDGGTFTGYLITLVWPLALAAAAIGVLALIAWGYGRTTVYTLTNRRIVIRSGVAFQVTFNIPFKTIVGAGLRQHRDGTGDIPLELDRSAHIAYLHMWPNVRPWHFTHVQPMLRNITDAGQVATDLKAALMAFQAENLRAGLHAELGATVGAHKAGRALPAVDHATGEPADGRIPRQPIEAGGRVPPGLGPAVIAAE